MGVPLDFTLLFMVIVILLFIITILLLFIEPNFDKSIAGMIICFVNSVFSYSSAYSLFVTNIYGFDYTGTIVANNIYDLYPFGMIFVIFVYINLILGFYALFLCYKKPWEAVLKSYGKKPEWYEQ